MEGCAQVKSINPGITLIEVMISMVIFSTLIGLSGQLIKKGIERPFAVEKIEPWLNYIQDTSLALQNIPNNSHLINPGSHTNPFSQFQPPGGLKLLKLEWQESNLGDVKIALFTATTIHGKIIKWRSYKKVP